jgi:hypothetical protein
VAAAGVREAETNIRAADAEVSRARADWDRYAALLKTAGRRAAPPTGSKPRRSPQPPRPTRAAPAWR